MSNTNPKIFLSYCWRDSSYADKIDNDFKSIGITLTRDVRDVGYRENIKEFMKRIGEHNFVVMLISKSYLESENCMYEVLELLEKEDFRNRILPVVLPDANIFKPKGKLHYIKYWEEQEDELKNALRNLKGMSAIQSVTKSIDQYRKIRNSIDGFLETISDMNCMSFEDLKKENYKSMLDIVGFDDEALLEEALRIQAIQNREEQEVALEDFLEKYPDNQYGLFYKAYLADVYREYVKAASFYKKLLEKYPDNAEAHNNYAILLNRCFKDYKNSRKHYEEALRISPEDSGYHNNYAKFLMEHSKEYKKSSMHFEKALRINPEYAKAHNDYAVLLEEHFEKYNEARQHYEIALHINPKLIEAHINLASLLAGHFKKYKSARKHFKIAININSKHAYAHYNYAGLLKNAFNDIDNALIHYREAIHLNPSMETKERNEFFGLQ